MMKFNKVGVTVLLLLFSHVFTAQEFSTEVKTSSKCSVPNCSNECLIGRELDSRGCETCDCVQEGLLESDIKVDNRTYKTLYRRYFGSKSKIESRGLQNNREKKWPKFGKFVEIGYGFDRRTVSGIKRNNIIKAMNKFHDNTCIRFVERTVHPDYLYFHGAGGCSSFVGRQGGSQFVSIGNGCDRLQGRIIHEIMHALGFYHEQSRGDRDSFVTINWNNVRSGTRRNFRKQVDWDPLGSPYDINSVMHYGGYYFSKNRNSPTIVDKRNKPVYAQREGFSAEDIKQINRYYDCTEYMQTTTPPTTTTTTTTAATTTTTTTPEATTTTANCSDNHRSCELWKNKGYCKYTQIKNRCLSTCNVCQESGTMTPQTTTTPRPTTSSTENKEESCKDVDTKSCVHWSKMGYCTDPTYRQVLKTQCSLTCGHCSPITTTKQPATTSASTTSGSCTDKYRSCVTWAEKDYCSQSDLVRQNCAKSCSSRGFSTLCTSQSGATSTVTTKPVTPCVDKQTGCQTLRNLCSSSTYKNYLTENCSKSCGFC